MTPVSGVSMAHVACWTEAASCEHIYVQMNSVTSIIMLAHRHSNRQKCKQNVWHFSMLVSLWLNQNSVQVTVSCMSFISLCLHGAFPLICGMPFSSWTYIPCNLFCFVIQPRCKLSAVMDNFTTGRPFPFLGVNGVFLLLNGRPHLTVREQWEILNMLGWSWKYLIAHNLLIFVS